MQSDDLSTEEVVTIWDVCWDLDRPFSSLVCVEGVDSPDTTGEAVFGDLEPVERGHVGDGAGIINLGHVGNDWSLVAIFWKRSK